MVHMFITESAKSVQDIFSPIKESVTFIIFIANLESISTIPHELQQWEGWELGNTKDTDLFRMVGLVRSHRLESYRYIPQRWVSASMWTVRVCTLSLWLQWGNTQGSICGADHNLIVPECQWDHSWVLQMTFWSTCKEKKTTCVLWLVVLIGYIHQKDSFEFCKKNKINVKTNHISLHSKPQYKERQ